MYLREQRSPIQKIFFCGLLHALLCCFSCDAQGPERPRFSPLDLGSWPAVEHPAPLGRPAPRLVVSEDGELLLDGLVLAASQLKEILPLTRGGEGKRLEILAAPRALFGVVFPLIEAALASGRTEISLLVASSGAFSAPGVLPGIRWSGEPPRFVLEWRASGQAPSLDGRKLDALVLAVSDVISVEQVFQAVDRLSGCTQRPCYEAPRSIFLQRLGAIDLTSYYSLGEGLYSKGVVRPSPPNKSPEEAKEIGVSVCQNPENASVVEVDCQPEPEAPYQKVLAGSTQKLQAARACYRIFMDCSNTGALVVYVDGDTGDILLKGE